MAYEIPNGNVAVCEIDITQNCISCIYDTPDSLLSAIGGELVFDGLTIIQKDIHISSFFFPLTKEFTATIQIANQSGQELDDTDLQGQFADAVAAVGNLQLNSALNVTKIIGAPSGTNTGTGTQGNVVITPGGAAQQAQQAAPAVHQCGDPSWSGFSDPVQWLKCLTQGGLTSLGLISVGLIIGVILIVYTSGGAVHPRRSSA